MVFLLNVNVLIAWIDPAHVQHDSAHEWFAAVGKKAWASCPLTENAVLRVVGDSRYSPGTPVAVGGIAGRLAGFAGAHFLGRRHQLLDTRKIEMSRLLNSRQVTDSYLLALAITHGGQLVTLDRRLAASAVRGASNGLHLDWLSKLFPRS